MAPCPPSPDAEYLATSFEAGVVRIVESVNTLRRNIEQKFEQHDTDLRAVVEQVNTNFGELLRRLDRLERFAAVLGD